MQLAPGTQVSADLTLVRPLREGAMGSVWVAHHAALGEQVAVKFVSGRARHDPQMLARFRREIAAVARLASPNVVAIIEHGDTEDGTPYLAMELLEGESLGERLERVKRLPMMVAAHVLRSVGNALDAAHSRGIVHRDIKPDNVFLLGADFPDVKVLDFGMAKQVRRQADGEVTATGVAVGTPEYMSPEQVLGSKDVDHRSDLWALGALTFRMLTGRTPFGGETPHSLFFNICKGAFPPLNEVGLPLELEPWFRRVFAPNKGKRFGSAREMVLRFEAILRELGDAEGSFDDESTQLVEVQRMFAPSAIEAEPSTTRSGAGAVRAGEPDPLERTYDLSALRLGDLDLLDHDDQPTFQLTAVQAAEIRAEARARLEDDGTPLPLLRPSRLPPTPSDAAEPSDRGAARASEPASRPDPSLEVRVETPSASASPSDPGEPSGRRRRVDPGEPKRTGRARSDPDVVPHEVPGSSRPQQRPPTASIPSRASNTWKVGIAAGVLVAGLAAGVVVHRQKAEREASTTTEPPAPASPSSPSPSTMVSVAPPSEAAYPEEDAATETTSREAAVRTSSPASRAPAPRPRPGPAPPETTPAPQESVAEPVAEAAAPEAASSDADEPSVSDPAPEPAEPEPAAPEPAAPEPAEPEPAVPEAPAPAPQATTAAPAPDAAPAPSEPPASSP